MGINDAFVAWTAAHKAAMDAERALADLVGQSTPDESRIEVARADLIQKRGIADQLLTAAMQALRESRAGGDSAAR